MSEPAIVVVMGVSGSGKSSVCEALASRLKSRGEAHVVYLDADDFHNAHNKEKMSRGEALTDADRTDWLAAINAGIGSARDDGARFVFVACSALKKTYRDTLRHARKQPEGSVAFIYLRGDEKTLRARLEARDKGGAHFAHVSLLASQIATLEEPDPRREASIYVCEVTKPDGTPKSREEIIDESMRCVERAVGTIQKAKGSI